LIRYLGDGNSPLRVPQKGGRGGQKKKTQLLFLKSVCFPQNKDDKTFKIEMTLMWGGRNLGNVRTWESKKN